MNTLRNKVIDEHIRDNYPNSKILNYTDPESGLTYYTADELQEVEEDWFPLCAFKNETGKVVYGGRSGIHHTYVEGETGAGKTTRFVMQSIRALASLKNKPSFLVVDLHGEIIENLHDHLKENGYDIKILNCADADRSDRYNPFSESVRECVEEGRITNDTYSLIKRICEIMNPVESQKDPSWERGAAAYTNGLILDRFEELVKGNIPPYSVNIYNVLRTHFWLRQKMNESQNPGSAKNVRDIFRIPYYKSKSQDSMAVQKMLAVTNCAESTQVSYFSVAETRYDIFNQPAFYKLSSDSTINIKDFIEKPTVIVVQSDNSTIGECLVSLLVNDIYNTVMREGKKNPNKRAKRNIQCFLDEFANCNIADKNEFTKMLTTSRKFGMYWHMLLQCDAQLEGKFDRDTGIIVRSNCTEIFMGSNDYATEMRFANSCGKNTIESLASVATGGAPSLEIVDALTSEKLHVMDEGSAYVKSNRRHVMRTYYEAFYKCPEFTKPDDIADVYPVNDFDYAKTVFLPEDTVENLEGYEFKILAYVKKNTDNGKNTTMKELQDKFTPYATRKAVLSLELKGILMTNRDGSYKSNISDEAMSFLEYKMTMSTNKSASDDDGVSDYYDDVLWDDDDDGDTDFCDSDPYDEYIGYVPSSEYWDDDDDDDDLPFGPRKSTDNEGMSSRRIINRPVYILKEDMCGTAISEVLKKEYEEKLADLEKVRNKVTRYIHEDGDQEEESGNDDGSDE